MNQQNLLPQDPSKKNKNTPNKQHVFFGLNVTYRVIKAIGLFLVVTMSALGFLGLGLGVGFFGALVSELDIPSKEEMQQKLGDVEQQSRLLYANDDLISVIKSDLVRTSVGDDKISPFIKQALVSTEDEYFYEHQGVVPKAIFRATVSDVTGLGASSGGSTITQQLIKQQILTNETSYKRKASEILLALRAEKFFSKKEVLNAYLNVSPFGRNNKGENIAGIEEAAMGIFGIHASDVTLPQAAFLAGLPQSPIEYSPYTNTGEFKESFEPGLSRKDDVLFNLYRDKQISKKEYEAALKYDLSKDFIAPSPRTNADNSFLYNYLYDEASRVLMPSYYEKDGLTEEQVLESDELFKKYFDMARRDVRRNGYTVHSTIDKDIYNAMQEGVQQYGYVLDDDREQTVETGSILMDNQTGRIYGFIGGRDYNTNQNNHAFQTKRSPGSTIKPILAYAPAIDVGLIGSESKLSDHPRNYSSGQPIINYADSGSNQFKSVRESLKWSLNIPVVNLYSELHNYTDPKTYFDKMKIGLNPDEYYRESIPLGGTDYGFTVLEETASFATLANKGQFNEGYSIDKITDNEGKVIYEHEADPVQVYKPATASIMNDMMRDVLISGTGQAAREAMQGVNPTLANADWVGKTGTSELEKDYWFTASTPRVTMSSWIGYDDPYPMYSTWNKQNMIYWAYMTNYVFQRSPEVFGVNERFELDSSVKKETVSEFSGQKVSSSVKIDNFTVDMTGAKTTTSLYATGDPKFSEFRFGIGGSDANYQSAWQSFYRPVEKKKPQQKRPPKKSTKKSVPSKIEETEDE